MNYLEIQIISLIPTKSGCALFLGNGKKIIHFFIDLHLGHTINAILANTEYERPMTHDLFASSIKALGGKMNKLIIHDYQDEVFFARVHLEISNEIQQRKIIDVDARPSDAIALAVRFHAPIYITRRVWREAEDMTHFLKDLQDQIEGQDQDVP